MSLTGSGRVEAKRKDGGWVDAGTVNATVDLLNLPIEGLELLHSSLPTGEYEMLRLFLTAEPTITLRADIRVGRTTFAAGEHPLSIPGSDENGLRLHAKFVVDAGGEILTIVVDGRATVRKVTATGSGVLKISPDLQVRGEGGEEVGELESERENDHGKELEKVKGLVLSVGDGSVTLMDETVVRVDDHTEIDGDLFTLGAVSEALAVGEAVRAEAKGRFLEDGSLLEVEFETEGEDPERNDDEEVEVEGQVTGVHPDAGTFTLVKGDHEVTVVVDDHTEIYGDLASLEAVAEALHAGHVVKAEAEGVLKDDGTLLAAEVEFAIREDQVEEVEVWGRVTAVQPDAGTFTLVKGDREVTVVVNDHTVFRGRFESPGAVAEALEAGHAIRAEAEGVLRDDGTVLAAVVAFAIREDEVEKVEVWGAVTGVHPDAGTFTLVKGDHEVTVLVNDHTVFHGEFQSLGAVAEALEAGHTLRAEAEVVLKDDGTVLAAVVAFAVEEEEVEEVEEVEVGGPVTGVNPDAGTFTMVKGNHELTVVVNDNTAFHGAFGSLGAVAEALEAGYALRAEAEGVLKDDGTILAAVVAFAVQD